MDGVVLFDKPAGMTSHDVVAGVRRAQARANPAHHPGGPKVKVGHAGTLDPFATGLLLVLVGRATRAQRWLMGLPKTYETVAQLGATSTTGDPEGEITATGRIPPDPPVLPTGTVRQRPPVHSAIHIDGERAYARARRGEEVVVPEREVQVTRFTQDWREGDRAGFTIACGSGTYVRSLIMALDDAYCLELRRTTVGPFAVADADPDRIVPLQDALALVMPVITLGGEDAHRAGHGTAVAAPADQPGLPPHVLLVDAAGPIAVAEPRAADGAGETGSVLKPVVGFRG